MRQKTSVVDISGLWEPFEAMWLNKVVSLSHHQVVFIYSYHIVIVDVLQYPDAIVSIHRALRPIDGSIKKIPVVDIGGHLGDGNSSVDPRVGITEAPCEPYLVTRGFEVFSGTKLDLERLSDRDIIRALELELSW